MTQTTLLVFAAAPGWCSGHRLFASQRPAAGPRRARAGTRLCRRAARARDVLPWRDVCARNRRRDAARQRSAPVPRCSTMPRITPPHDRRLRRRARHGAQRQRHLGASVRTALVVGLSGGSSCSTATCRSCARSMRASPRCRPAVRSRRCVGHVRAALPVTIVRAALLIASPALAVTLTVQVALAAVARVVPRLANFSLAFPVVFAVAIVVALTGIPLFAPLSAHPWLVLPYGRPDERRAGEKRFDATPSRRSGPSAKATLRVRTSSRASRASARGSWG